jgi:hypothetical protein
MKNRYKIIMLFLYNIIILIINIFTNNNFIRILKNKEDKKDL